MQPRDRLRFSPASPLGLAPLTRAGTAPATEFGPAFAQPRSQVLAALEARASADSARWSQAKRFAEALHGGAFRLDGDEPRAWLLELRDLLAAELPGPAAEPGPRAVGAPLRA